MDTAQWPQGVGVVNTPRVSIARPVQPAAPPSLVLERRSPAPAQAQPPSARPQKEQALNCPRCNSSNTKFCYYNNYSLSQPRYFCKACRRYWTEGGSLRNVPIGGGSRKNKRSSSSSSSSSSQNSTPLSSNYCYNTINYNTHDTDNTNLSPPPQTFLVPHQIMDPSKLMILAAGQDLNLACPPPPPPPPPQPSSSFKNYDNAPSHHIPNPSSPAPQATSPHHLSAMELLKIKSFPVSESGSSSGGLYTAMGFGVPGYSGEYKPGLRFPVGGFEQSGGGHGGERGQQESSGGGGCCRLLFPYEDLKQQGVSSEGPDIHHGNRDPNSNTTTSSAGYSYWNGMLGTGGGSW